VKIVVAPNAFKGCLTARAAAAAMSAGVARALPTAEIVQVPVADGGDGLVEVVRTALGGDGVSVPVTGPLGERIEAQICHHRASGLVAIEMALASGLALVPAARRDALAASTVGTGELIARALDLGARKIIVGIGGSATTDGGTGMAHALGVRFFDAIGRAVVPNGAALAHIRSIDLSGRDPRLAGVRIEAACDVDNPLYGPRGAARVFGPQKGATAEQVEQLDAGLENLAAVIERDLGVAVGDLPGAGAAGGLGAGLKAFLGAELRRGSELVLDIVGLDRALENADLVLTGEGSMDEQTAAGKAPAVVAARARARGCACIAVTGRRVEALDALHAAGIDAVFSLCLRPMTLETAMSEAASLITAATEEAVRAFVAGRRASRSLDTRT
jgi:glycerate kinase